jgi:two-component system nitrate/nitrite response regulator NarL
MRTDMNARVLIVDDDDFTRVLLTSTLRGLGCSVVGDCATVTDAMSAAGATKPDLALIDLDLGKGPTGIDLAYGLRKLLPGIGIVMLSSYEEPRLVGQQQRELPFGSMYVVKKTVSDPEILNRAIRMALEPATHTAASDFAAGGSRSLESLSDAQVEIMRLVAAGYSNAEIARRRSLSEPAVGKAVARLIKQLDLAATKEQNQRVLIAQTYFQLTGAVSTRRD